MKQSLALPRTFTTASQFRVGRVAAWILSMLLLVTAMVMMLAAVLWQPGGPVLSQKGAVTSIAYAPDGTLLATGSGDNAVRLWQPQTGELVATLRGHTDWVFHVAFAPDGRTVVSASWDGTVRLWRVRDGVLLHTLQHADLVWMAAFAPDGQTIATASQNGAVSLWRVADGVLLRTWLAHTRAAHDVAFTPDGQTLVSGGEDGLVKLWRVDNGALLSTLHAGGRVLGVAVSPDGRTIATSARAGMVLLWRTSDGAVRETLRGHTDRVFSVTFAPDGERLLSTGDNGLAHLWRVRDGALLATMSAQQRQFVYCGLEQGWRLIQRCHIEPSANLLMYAAAFSPDGQHIAIVDGTTLRIDPPHSLFGTGSALTQPMLLVGGGVCLLLSAGLLFWGLRHKIYR